MRDQGLGSWPERRLVISPEKPALWFEGATSTYRELALDVRRTASALHGLGVRRGDRVAWLGANHPTALHLLYACGQLGAVWVPVNARLSPAEAHYVLEHSGTTVVVHGKEHAGTAEVLRAQLPGIRAWTSPAPTTRGR